MITVATRVGPHAALRAARYQRDSLPNGCWQGEKTKLLEHELWMSQAHTSQARIPAQAGPAARPELLGCRGGRDFPLRGRFPVARGIAVSESLPPRGGSVCRVRASLLQGGGAVAGAGQLRPPTGTPKTGRLPEASSCSSYHWVSHMRKRHQRRYALATGILVQSITGVGLAQLATSPVR